MNGVDSVVLRDAQRASRKAKMVQSPEGRMRLDGEKYSTFKSVRIFDLTG